MSNLSMHGQDILCEISKIPFEILHKYLAHTMTDVRFIQIVKELRALRFKSS